MKRLIELIILIVSLFMIFGCGGSGGGGGGSLSFNDNVNEFEFPENSVLSCEFAFYDSAQSFPQAQRYIYEDNIIEKVLPYIYSVGGLKLDKFFNDYNFTGVKEYYDELKDYTMGEVISYYDHEEEEIIFLNGLPMGYGYDNGYVVRDKWTVHMYSWVNASSDNSNVITDKFGYSSLNKDERISLYDIYGPDADNIQVEWYNATSNPNFLWILYAHSSLKDEIDEINSDHDLLKPRIYVYKYMDSKPDFSLIY